MKHHIVVSEKSFFYWLAGAGVITILSGFIYGAVQQDLRQSANDPQIQMAEDAARWLEGGALPLSVLPVITVDISQSLSPYLIVFNEQHNPLATSATLHGTTPVPPEGVFAFARTHGEDRLTWQPEIGVRSAIVVIHYGGPQPGFVLTGRSLREVEKREEKLSFMTTAAWLIALFVSLLGFLFVGYLGKLR